MNVTPPPTPQSLRASERSAKSSALESSASRASRRSDAQRSILRSLVAAASPLEHSSALVVQRIWRGWWWRSHILRGSSHETGRPILAKISSRLRRRLYKYQLAGVRWAYAACTGPQNCGGILGDDPGLGKTLQAIALIEAMCSAQQTVGVLLVVPPSLLTTWQKELRRWAPLLPVTYLFDTSTSRLHAQQELTALAAVQLPHQRIVVVSYDLLVLYGGGLRVGGGVDLLVVDEAHRLRNGGELAQGVTRVPSRARLLLTATPLANHEVEFYALADACVHGIYGTEDEFQVDIVRPLAAGRRADADERAKEDAADAMSEYTRVAGLVMLRRTNQALKRGLPSCHTLVLLCRPTKVQRNLHDLVAASSESALVRLARLRSLHVHAPLLEGKKRAEALLFRQVVPKTPEQPPTLMLLSGKMQACAILLRELLLGSEERIVVVSSRLAVLNTVAAYVQHILVAEATSGAVMFITSKAAANKARLERQRVEFNSGRGARVCCLIDKMSEGLTLIGARHLILMDASWNPAVDIQSMGRVHRPGQLKECYLYRLISTGSVEETIMERQTAKEGLLQAMQSNKLPPIQSEDRRLLFALDQPEVASRLWASMPADCAYRNEAVWTAIDPLLPTDATLPHAALSTPWLNSLFAAELQQFCGDALVGTADRAAGRSDGVQNSGVDGGQEGQDNEMEDDRFMEVATQLDGVGAGNEAGGQKEKLISFAFYHRLDPSAT
uniref:Helicase ATP-binding domain-containing protein n=2 Tax=Calcidiscus leptoporus TaxID=127549 RepID=A0A7S0J6H7_9EUKA|mmetsp:Transcript_40695/g.95032  ORF Transcript_40695/g.95032 Transcript_40695/m.95032 type:complete len:727 (+) Transcript_40695:289-2469(+)|eukprot:CAMPEP_0119375118 /NCGR_PEP_ID=MMETSP1334-20130426/33804_1 /TAXON_ID=127549 /ORGANISM="Calcidiscus leptoporus, Strain RCC1130" /LENGTH=726 /DNA_ID=CAMNT_0007393343 /DNA_START=210 /DNA_END=2390 /DNA_ORIENTATION=-